AAVKKMCVWPKRKLIEPLTSDLMADVERRVSFFSQYVLLVLCNNSRRLSNRRSIINGMGIGVGGTHGNPILQALVGANYQRVVVGKCNGILKVKGWINGVQQT